MDSTHKVEIIPIELKPAANADALSIVQIFQGGYQVIVRTDDWKNKYIGSWVPPDSLVPLDRPEFSFLKNDKFTKEISGYARIRARKLRGNLSFGLLVPAPPGSKLGDDVAEQLGVMHYEPPEESGLSTGGEACGGPAVYYPKYDVESLRKYHYLFKEGEPVFCSEKIHGVNGRFVFVDGNIYCGSRTEWKRYNPNNLWWKAFADNLAVSGYIVQHAGDVVYGEVYGAVQKMRYGCSPGELRIAVFDIMRNGRWLPTLEARKEGEALPWVPTLSEREPFNLDRLLKFADGPSTITGAKHIREGFVVNPVEERWTDEIGRLKLKAVSAEYLEKY